MADEARRRAAADFHAALARVLDAGNAGWVHTGAPTPAGRALDEASSPELQALCRDLQSACCAAPGEPLTCAEADALTAMLERAAAAPKSAAGALQVVFAAECVRHLCAAALLGDPVGAWELALSLRPRGLRAIIALFHRTYKGTTWPGLPSWPGDTPMFKLIDAVSEMLDYSGSDTGRM